MCVCVCVCVRACVHACVHVCTHTHKVKKSFCNCNYHEHVHYKVIGALLFRDYLK